MDAAERIIVSCVLLEHARRAVKDQFSAELT